VSVIVAYAPRSNSHLLVGDFGDEVLVGAWLVNETNGTAAEWRKIVSEMVVHPEYNDSAIRNDFMLFKIEPVSMPGLVPITLNTDPSIPTLADQFAVVGMGFNSSNYTSADRLLKVQVRYVDHDLCQGQWNLLDDDFYYNETREVFDESMICAIGDFSATKGPTKGTIPMRSISDAVVAPSS
jgi:Trypsin